MAFYLVLDELWSLVAPVLPVHRPSPKGGRPPIPDRIVLGGPLYVLRTRIPWEAVPQETIDCSGMTLWRRLRDWQEAGVWQRMLRILLRAG